MSKKGENIYKRKDNRYEGRYAYSKDSSGRIRYKSVYGKTFNECREKLIKAKADFIDNKSYTKLTMTVRILSQKWLSCIASRVKESTLSTYKQILEKHIFPIIGNIRVCDVTTEMLNDFVSQKLANGKLNGKGGLTAKTTLNIICVLKSAFKYAKQTYSAVDPTEFINMPKANKSKIDILSNTEISKIKEYCSQNDGYISFAVELCLSLGIRIGELCALQVSDFNFEKGFLTINKSVQRVKNISVNSSKTKVIISSPKTNFSERQIPLPKDLTNKILMYFNEHSLKDNDFLFCSKKGKQLDVRTIQKNFSSMLKKCGIRPVKFHILRHTFATMWVNKNLNVKALSEILGHSNINTTLSLYVHPSIDAKREMMNVFYSAG